MLNNGGGGSVDGALAALRREYAAELPGLIDELEALVAAARTDADAARRAKTAAHRLRGTAGSYGFFAIGEASGRIEDSLAAAPDGSAAEMPGLVAALRGHLAAVSGPDAQASSAGLDQLSADSSGSSK